MKLLVKLCLIGLASALTISATQAQNTTNNFSLEVTPSASYQLAKAQFLPDFTDSEWGYNSHDLTAGSIADDDSCSAYPLSSCPANGNCSQCPTNRNKYRLNSCVTDFRLTPNRKYCVPNSCENLTKHREYYDYSSYGELYSTPPTGMSCTYGGPAIKVNGIAVARTSCYGKCTYSNCEALGYSSTHASDKRCVKYSPGDSLTCYAGCTSISCSGYTLNKSPMPSHAKTMVQCPDCSRLAYANIKTVEGIVVKQITTPNCGLKYYKISACEDGYKVNSSGTQCLSDTCPNGYNKECETGTQGTPQYTEYGTACYQCKAPGSRCVELGYNNSIQWGRKIPNDGQTYSFVKTATCPYDSNYWMGYWSPTTCNSPKRGSYLYSDKTCSTQLISAKTVIGVIFTDPSITSRRIAVALKPGGGTWIDTSKADEWSNVATGAFEIPRLTDHASPLEVDNGKANTKIIAAYCKGLGASCPAAETAYAYKTAGTSAGDWYLPSTVELEWLFADKATMDKSLVSVGALDLYAACYVWSSEERLGGEAWTWLESQKRFISAYKGNGYCSHIILDLDQIGKEPSCSPKPCSSTTYPLTSCPANGHCTPCSTQGSQCTQTMKFKLDSCDDGYTMLNNTCQKSFGCAIISCSGYNLTSCPSTANCSSCTATSSSCVKTRKYKIDSCKSGYVLTDNTCVQDTDCTVVCAIGSTSIPAHAATYSTCTPVNSSCQKGTTVYRATACQSGYKLDGLGGCIPTSTAGTGSSLCTEECNNLYTSTQCKSTCVQKCQKGENYLNIYIGAMQCQMK